MVCASHVLLMPSLPKGKHYNPNTECLMEFYPLFSRLPSIKFSSFLIQVSDETTYVKMLESDRSRQLQELHAKMDESSSLEINNQKAFEDEIQSSLHAILASDESRRAAFLLAQEEEQQNVAVC